MDCADFPDFYQILGIDSNASSSIIKQRYHQLSLQHHPDKQSATENSSCHFVQVNTAYRVLSDIHLKQQYDLQYVAFKNCASVNINDQVNITDLDEDNDSYDYTCRCGGIYTLSKEMAELPIPSLSVCCDTCSLCIQVILWCLYFNILIRDKTNKGLHSTIVDIANHHLLLSSIWKICCLQDCTCVINNQYLISEMRFQRS